MIIQRRIYRNVQKDVYWEDLAINDSIVINPLAYLKTLGHPTGTEYRIIPTTINETRYAIVTQPTLPSKEIEYIDNST